MSLLLSLMFATAPAAQEPVRRQVAVGSRLERRVETDVWDSKEAREVQVKYGECVIKKQLAAARHFVLTPNMDKSQWRKDVAKVGDGYCLAAVAPSIGGVEMTFPVDTMRYALADALVRKEFSAGPVPAIKDAAPLERPKLDESEYVLEPGKKPKKGELEKLQENRQKRIALIYLAEFGECVVRADPLQSHALLIAQPGSIQEDVAFKAMMPTFGSCLAAGQSLSFNKSTLRGTIAMNYYRLAHAPKVAAATAGVTK